MCAPEPLLSQVAGVIIVLAAERAGCICYAYAEVAVRCNEQTQRRGEARGAGKARAGAQPPPKRVEFWAVGNRLGHQRCSCAALRARI